MGQGFGSRDWTRPRTSAGGSSPLAAIGPPLSGAAVVSTATARSSRSAWSTMPAIAARRSSQPTAEAQPSSTTRSTGPSLRNQPPGDSTGWARPKMMSAPRSSRRSASHSGVRAAVSSAALRPNRSLSAGNRTRRGAGGVILRSHHSAGSTASPISSHGLRKVREPRKGTAYASRR